MTTKKYGTKKLREEFGPLTFGNALEAYRLTEEITQADFAKLLGISAQSLCDIEKGRRVPTPKRAAKIAKQIEQPENFWIQLAFQDMLRKEELNYTVSVA
ncbi:MAG: helix-turn-helix domain-containing protein [Proteobacteria bacterium]|nr:helix-turn-helix domain-containing protein [Pseudomonadota bacterium]MBU1386801.1 helix-turn-helix domain-containing protein [Pseudomonadota bacterium]MBU1544745.1 helix-turn-helix domain-containing protein [Pseudomonadota bacterium]MBU2481914.1 helix-turn-helix domain-containing protein [Pseudomonadota bacterium]